MSKEKQEKKQSKNTYFYAVGRRRTSHAQVRLYPMKGKNNVVVYNRKLKKGDLIVNKKDASEYFPGEINKVLYRAPFVVTQSLNDFAVSAKVAGGGKKGQLGAVVHGIARCLEKADPSFRPLLKKYGFLRRDPRMKERRKAGFAQKARARKQSPKR